MSFAERQHDADHGELAKLQLSMEKILAHMDAEAENYANARQISEFIGDRKKSALADAIAAIMHSDPELSAAMAEHRARASRGYKDKMQELQRDCMKSERIIANYHLLQTRLEVARSWMACERVKLERL